VPYSAVEASSDVKNMLRGCGQRQKLCTAATTTSADIRKSLH
jgi:hypothetical protein